MWSEEQREIIEESAVQSLPFHLDTSYRREVWAELKAYEGEIIIPESRVALASVRAKKAAECRVVYRQTYLEALNSTIGRLVVWNEHRYQWRNGNPSLHQVIVEAFTISQNDTTRLLHLPGATYGYVRSHTGSRAPHRYVDKARPRDFEDGILETFMSLYAPYSDTLMRDPKKALQAARDIHAN